ncbi:hypothetical protein D3C86_1105690 [compost metagenome]
MVDAVVDQVQERFANPREHVPVEALLAAGRPEGDALAEAHGGVADRAFELREDRRGRHEPQGVGALARRGQLPRGARQAVAVGMAQVVQVLLEVMRCGRVGLRGEQLVGEAARLVEKHRLAAQGIQLRSCLGERFEQHVETRKLHPHRLEVRRGLDRFGPGLGRRRGLERRGRLGPQRRQVEGDGVQVSQDRIGDGHAGSALLAKGAEQVLDGVRRLGDAVLLDHPGGPLEGVGQPQQVVEALCCGHPAFELHHPV